MSYNLVNPETGDLTRVAGGSFSIPVGTLISQYKKVAMSGYLYCDGSTFDENKYPALYMYLGTNVLPDYRECVMVGAEENTTDTIATHDVYGEGEFKDDQIQSHRHLVKDTAFGTPLAYGMDAGNGAGVVDRTVTGQLTNRAWEATGAGFKDTVSRYGETTHGKQKAVYVYIKATSGLAENQQENVLKDVKDYVNNSMDKVVQPIGFKTSLLNQCCGYYTKSGKTISVHMKFVLSSVLSDWQPINNTKLPAPSSAITKSANGKTGATNSVYIYTNGAMSQAGGGGMPAGTYEFDFDYTMA